MIGKVGVFLFCRSKSLAPRRGSSVSERFRHLCVSLGTPPLGVGSVIRAVLPKLSIPQQAVGHRGGRDDVETAGVSTYKRRTRRDCFVEDSSQRRRIRRLERSREAILTMTMIGGQCETKPKKQPRTEGQVTLAKREPRTHRTCNLLLLVSAGLAAAYHLAGRRVTCRLLL